MSDEVKRIKVIDSHTAGEPTRVVVEGLPVHLQPQEPSMVQQEQEQES